MPMPTVVQRISVGKDVPLVDQVRGIKAALEEAAKQAKWKGGVINVDIGFHIGVLTLMEKIVERVEALEDAQCDPMRDGAEKEEALVAVD